MMEMWNSSWSRDQNTEEEWVDNIMIKVFQVIIREVAFRTSRLTEDIDMTQITM